MQTSTLVPIVSVFLYALCCYPSGGHASRNPVSLSELLKLPLHEISVQKKAVVPNADGSKAASKQQLQAVELKISEFKMALKKRLEDPTTSKPRKVCLSQCQENFLKAIDGVKMSIKSIDKQDIHKANVDVSAVATDVDTCNECFVELVHEDPEIKAFDDWVREITGNCLVSLKKARG
ncbi:hypothetical protein QVD17_27750 [Tagetes erecta]|uniref:Pectinesterase inhibitor domain-containing protein n=1 Tax=Tagetes erecta TaxID=13708 RepID=A0AAD8NJT0_TARER|nr:hypothetical protein QVD17_27750 [Tagetes erecta]